MADKMFRNSDDRQAWIREQLRVRADYLERMAARPPGPKPDEDTDELIARFNAHKSRDFDSLADKLERIGRIRQLMQRHELRTFADRHDEAQTERVRAIRLQRLLMRFRSAEGRVNG